MESRTLNSGRNILYGMITKVVCMLLPFAIRTIIVRKMGIAYGGLNTLFSSILSFLSLSELGFGSTLVYMMYKPVAENDTEKICALLNLYKKVYHVVGCIILVIGALLIPYIPKLVSGEVPPDISLTLLYIPYLLNVAISYFLFSYRSSLFVAFQRTDIQSKISLMCYLGMSLLQLLVIVFLRNYYLYAFSNIVYTVALNLLVNAASKRLFPEIICRGSISKDEKKTLLEKTFALAGHKIGGTIVSSLDSIVISHIMGLAVVGIYGNYYTIIAALMAFIGVYNSALMPSIGNHVITESMEKTYKIFVNLNFGHTWVVGWSTICMIVLFPQFMELWVGNSLTLGMTETVLFGLYYYSWQFRVLLCNFKEAAGLWTQDFIKPYIASVLNIVLNVVLVRRIGICGALISTIICMVVVFYPFEINTLFRCLFKRSSFFFNLLELKWLVMWSCIGFFTIKLSGLITIDNLLLSLLVKLGICVVVPNVLFAVANIKTEEFRYIINKFSTLWRRRERNV